jgi:prefoldin subunit 5
VSPYPFEAPFAGEEAELQALKRQAGSVERTLEALRRRIQTLESEAKAEE